jgi:hypothetical protein
MALFYAELTICSKRCILELSDEHVLIGLDRYASTDWLVYRMAAACHTPPRLAFPSVLQSNRLEVFTDLKRQTCEVRTALGNGLPEGLGEFLFEVHTLYKAYRAKGA